MRIIAGLLLLAFFAIAARADWPQFRGPSGQGHCTEKDLPTTWSAKGENGRWKVDLPKSNDPWSSPVVRGDKLFLTFATNAEPKRQWISAYAIADGKELYSNPDLRADQPPVKLALPVAGADQLRLLIDYGRGQDTGDRVIWANARLYRQLPAGSLTETPATGRRNHGGN